MLAEALTIERAITHLVNAVRMNPEMYQNQRILIVSDSQSSIAALEKGPIAQTEEMLNGTWRKLIEIANSHVYVHFQFVYAHCGVKLNEEVDQAATSARLNLPTPDVTPVWLTDVSNNIRQSIKQRSAELLNRETHRESLVGIKPQTLDRFDERTKAVRFARLRTGESLEVGKARRRIGLDHTMACRWCAPQAHEEAAPPPPPADDVPVRRVYKSTEPAKCPYCENTLANLKSLRSHVSTQHKDQPPIPSERAPRPKAVPQPKAAPIPEPNPPEPPPPQHDPLNTDIPFPIESVRHIFCECDALADLRKEFPSLFALEPTPRMNSEQQMWSKLRNNDAGFLDFLDKAKGLLSPTFQSREAPPPLFGA
jgi:hypothetical protein